MTQTLPGLLSVMLLLSPPEATALEWYALPIVAGGVSYNDNINMTAGPHDSLVYYNVSPQITAGVGAPHWTLSAAGQVNRLEFPSDKQQSRTDYLLDLKYNRRNELNQWGLAGNFTRDSTLDSERELSGFVTNRSQRTQTKLTPSWTWLLSARDSATFEYSHQDVQYDTTRLTLDLLDYTTQAPRIILKHSLTEKNALYLTLDHSKYETDRTEGFPNIQFKNNTTSLQLGVDHSFTSTLNGTLTVGRHKTDSSVEANICVYIVGVCFPREDSSSTNLTGSLFNARLVKTFESSQLSGMLSRSLQPTGSGGLVQVDALALSYKTSLSPTLEGGLDISARDAEFTYVSTNSFSSRYYDLTPTLTWRVTEMWTVISAYDYSRTESSIGSTAKSNAINLTLKYNWPRISRSR